MMITEHNIVNNIIVNINIILNPIKYKISVNMIIIEQNDVQDIILNKICATLWHI